MKNLARLILVLVVAVGAAAAAHAGERVVIPGFEQACAASKLKAASIYAGCRYKVDAAAAAHGGTADYSKCEQKFSSMYQAAETKAGPGVCPSEGDQSDVLGFLGACGASVVETLGQGATLPMDPQACEAALASAGSCPGNLATCGDNLASCTSSLSSTSNSLGTCTTSLSSANGSLSTCTSSLGACTTALASGAACPSDLLACNTSLGTCSADLGSTNADLSACSSGLSTCNASLSTTNADLSACSASLATCSASLVGGSMPNNGSVKLTPGTTNKPIALGYHDGTGYCEGDADLVARNVKAGVTLFGVAGTAGVGVPSTGQTTGYGSGSDGDLQEGAAPSFTDHGDGTITDNATGLMWEKKSDDGSVHDKDNNYSWSTGTNNLDGSIVTSFLATLNAGGGFAGHTDWRIPNIKELQTLVSFGGAFPTIYAAFSTDCVAACTVTTCSCTRADYSWDHYWSSTTNQNYPNNAWIVNFGDGYVLSSHLKDSVSAVRAVRSGS